MKLLRAVVLLIAIGCLLASMGLHAQTESKPRRQFEVASIKPDNAGRPVVQTNPLVFSGSRFTATNVTLVDVIVRVYPTRRIQMRGGPDWIDSERWDIIAKADEAQGEIHPDQRQEIVQTLLEDRFKLKFHVESREMDVLALIADKNGPKLQPSKDGEVSAAGPGDQPGQFRLQRTTIIGLVNTLANVLQTPVIDGSGITGFYDITLDTMKYLAAPGGSNPRTVDAIDRAQAFVTAVQDQLGLKLEKRKAALDITIIDRAERPTED